MRTISVHRFRKTFHGRRRVEVSVVDWSADSARPVWLQGPNGSGKTTFLRSVAGWIVEFEGEITIDGRSVRELWAPAAEIALLPTSDFLPRGFTLERVVRTFASYAGISARAFAAAVEREIGLLGAQHLTSGETGEWSTGETKLLSLALFFALDRPVELLDEPFSALDDSHRALLARRIEQEAARNHLVIYTDHRECGPLSSNVCISLSGESR